MKAVHFGAGNIGRGFVGLLLHEAGYEVVFADVAEDLITDLAAADSYRVHEVGEHPTVRTVENFRALNSTRQEAEVIAEISTADMVTTAVGPHILKFVAPVIAKGIAARAAGLAPLQVMACENAINATDILKSEVSARWDGAAGSLDDKLDDSSMTRQCSRTRPWTGSYPTRRQGRAWTSRSRRSTNGSSTGPRLPARSR